MLAIYYALCGASIIFMTVGLVMALRLSRYAKGGDVGKVLRILLVFIALFFAGYIAAPFMPLLPAEAGHFLMGVVFLFGAIYVIIVLWLLGRRIKQIDETLGL
jgi:hypothetical protein